MHVEQLVNMQTNDGVPEGCLLIADRNFGPGPTRMARITRETQRADIACVLLSDSMELADLWLAKSIDPTHQQVLP